jgi:hypothetical protein
VIREAALEPAWWFGGKNLVSMAGDEAIVRELLAALPEPELLALASYYRGLKGASEIEQWLQLRPGRMAEIRMELRKRFLARLLSGAEGNVGGGFEGCE